MPSRPHRPPRRAPPPAPVRGAVGRPLDEGEIDELQARLEAVPAPLEPLDASMLDGFLCAVLVQPVPLAASRWLPFVTDIDGRPLPAGFDAAPLHALVLRRHAELDAAIAGRRWFDPWVFEVEAEEPGAEHPDQLGDRDRDRDDDKDDDKDDDHDDEDADAASVRAAVYPWVAGFATAFETFPAAAQAAEAELLEPLALLYRHLDPDDLEPGDAVHGAIAAEEPAADLADAVEGLVRATLLLADVAGRPAATRPPGPPRRPPRRPGSA